VLSAVRAGGVEVRNPEPLLGTMSRLGMPLYLCQTPDGYKNTEEAWLSPDATTLRINFASLLTSGAYLLYVPPSESRQAANPMAASHLVADAAPAAGLKPKPIDPAALENLLSPTLGERTRETVAAAPDWLKASLILGSPDFMRR
jgi:hypothetical protein